MGRFYKTSAQTPVDYMYQLPKELMIGAIQATDKKIDTEIVSADAAQKKLDLVKNLNADNEYVAGKYNDYEQKIGGLAEEIRKNPMGYRTLGGQMRKVSREIEQDITRGGLFQAQQQYEEFEKYKELTNKRTNINAARKKDLIDASEKRYGGLDYENPSSFNTIKKHTIGGFSEVDEDKLINVLADNFKADKTGWASSGVNGMYITNASGTTEERTPAQVKKVIDASLQSSGWEDYNRESLTLDKELGRLPENANIDQLLMSKRKLLVEKAVEKLAYKETTAHKSMSGDSMYAYKKQAAEEAEGKGTEIRVDIGEERDHRLVATGNKNVNDLAGAGLIPGAKNVNEVLMNMVQGKKGSTYKDVYNILRAQGKFKTGKPEEDFAQWFKSNLNAEVKYVPAEKEIVKTYNSKSINNPANLYFRDANNNRVASQRASLGDYIHHMQKQGVIVLDPSGTFGPTSTSSKPSLIKGAAPANITSYEFKGEDYKTENLKKKTSYEVNLRGEITPVTSYVDLIKVNTYDTKTKTYNLVEVEVEIPEHIITNKKQ